jgi:hypothetical protein
MKPLQLMRTLFGFEATVDDYQMVVLVYQEMTKLQANLQIQAAVQQALNPKESNGEIQPSKV